MPYAMGQEGVLNKAQCAFLEEALMISLTCLISPLLFSPLFRNMIVSVRLQRIENETESSINKQ